MTEKKMFWGDMMETISTISRWGNPITAYKCPDCDWQIHYQYRNAKKAFKQHWTLHHYPELKQETISTCPNCGEEINQ